MKQERSGALQSINYKICNVWNILHTTTLVCHTMYVCIYKNVMVVCVCSFFSENILCMQVNWFNGLPTRGNATRSQPNTSTQRKLAWQEIPQYPAKTSQAPPIQPPTTQLPSHPSQPTWMPLRLHNARWHFPTHPDFHITFGWA